MSGPTISRGESSGEIWTPKPFIAAVTHKFGPLTVDLAATPECTCAPAYLTKADDALDPARRWHRFGGLCWLNPPYSDIGPWAEKCAVECEKGARILLLVPGSIGANWWWDYVEPYADVYSIGRLTFDNCFDRKTGKLVRTPYPKDLALCHYSPWPGAGSMRMQRWQWRKEVVDTPTTTMVTSTHDRRI